MNAAMISLAPRKEEDATMGIETQGSDDRYHKRREKEDAHRKQLPGVDDDALPAPVEPIQADQKPKRNDPCTCGSGKKFKQCCGSGR